eukprot:CAMPEP_0204350954 /NCGR_PEP_ID=MMETSP0469-20131031/30744_1 /ASSEMBLY_ACC=CAM_ASM_000384 /TAXON_ID=2969 /ORGANISM="Oxyrrhis marina" /LENGTH=45 /DNA_ID= /DNA_START= /DNA_END= /DNA_ORIENTATION=
MNCLTPSGRDALAGVRGGRGGAGAASAGTGAAQELPAQPSKMCTK